MSVRSLRYNSLMLGQAKYRSASTDRDAAAFLEAAGIYKSDQRKAIYELVRLLKQYGLWSKMEAIYPFVGGTAATHKLNLKDPRDLDAAYRLTFSGGWTHSGTGALPNGTNAYANTFFSVNTLGTNDLSLSYYSRTNAKSDDAVEMGAANPTTPATLISFNFVFGGVDYGSLSRINCSFVANLYNPADTLEYMVTSSGAANSSICYHKNIQRYTNTTTSATTGIRRIYIGAGNYTSSNVLDGDATYFTSKECAFATIGKNVTATEAALLHSAVDKYQRLLSRNV